MESTNKPKLLKGFRDFLPEVMVVREKIIGTLREVFSSYGFKPLETPALEYQSTLLDKYGEEAEKMMYLFKDRGGRDVGLRYDLTVPLARVVASYPEIPKPFKRYQIQRVWRADKPQKGRYREFTQCDIDIIGSASPLADSEIIAVVYTALTKLGFGKFVIRINSRQVLFSLMKKVGISKNRWLVVIQSIDKLDKLSKNKVAKELLKKGLTEKQVKDLYQCINSLTPDSHLKKVFAYLKILGIPEGFYKFDPILARGLDYYTGPIFETVIEKPRIGSITGGGRFDKLINQFSGVDFPAVGTSFGLDRIIDVIFAKNLIPNLSRTPGKTLVTIFNENLLNKSLEIAKMLRSKGIETEFYLNEKANLSKQLKYAQKAKIDFALIVGPEEIRKNKIVIKNLKTGKQENVQVSQLIARLK